jgi:CRP/FNR family transcriptional regulator, cyclic AMP receptor protein
MGGYDQIMKIAFQAEEGLDEKIMAQYGRRYAPKQILIREGDTQQMIFWIIEGEVYVTRRLGDKYRILATLGKGEILGEMSFFDRSVRSATVISKSEVLAIVFNRDSFADIYMANPAWLRRLIVSLSKRIRSMVERISDL